MKKIIFTSFLVLSVAFVYSAFGVFSPRAYAENGGGENGRTQVQNNSDSTGTRVNSGDVNQNQNDGNVNATSSNQGEDNSDVEIEHADINIRSTSSLGVSIRNREMELDNEIASSTDPNRQISLKDNNNMRLAVHTLLSSKDILGGIGPEVSALAQNLNDSVTSTISAETKIQSRGWLRKLFFGGDQTNSASLQGQVNQNLETIQKLNDLIANCASCSVDLKTTLQNRLSLAQVEQTKLQAIAQSAMQSKGIFGVLFGWAGR